jgi:phosphoribosylanthranilate isomerase
MALPLRIKICGITNEDDAMQAAYMGADAIGLNFHPGSPRHVDPARADAILRVLPPFVEAVGVFVNTPLRDIYEFIHPLGRLRTIQWYGQERELARCYPLHYIAAFPVRDADSLRPITRYLDSCRMVGASPSGVLVDAYMPGQHGGTGRTVPWSVLADFRPDVPLLLAGGLTPENVAEAIRIVQPYAVDVASGVESEPGIKDHERMLRFIASAREAAARL